MTVRLTSQVLGKPVGDSYTGPLESWLLNEGYATVSTAVPDAWGEDSDGILGAKAPVVTVTPTAAVLVGSAAVTDPLGTAGTVVFATKGGVSTSVTLAATDTPAQAATKIDTALAGKADAAIVSTKLQVTSVATGPKAYVTVVSGTAGVLTALKLTVDQVAYGGDGRPTGASNTGVQADTPANDPKDAANREAPYWPLTPDRNATIANDSVNLTKEKFPAPNFDFDAGAVDTEAPSQVVLNPTELPLTGGPVVAYGNNLENVTSVTVDGTTATDFDDDAVADGVLTFTAPAKTAGAKDVVFVDASGNTTVTGGLTYKA